MTERSPLDQLVDVLVYAPIGLLYEREAVLPRLVTRGRSQVQLARVLGQLALRQGQSRVEDRLGDALIPAGSGFARLVTSVGAQVGLAPKPPAPAAPPDQPLPLADDDADAVAPLPIAGYDDLPARTIVALLVDLSPSQRQVVGQYERSHRARATILGQIERLGS